MPPRSDTGVHPAFAWQPNAADLTQSLEIPLALAI